MTLPELYLPHSKDGLKWNQRHVYLLESLVAQMVKNLPAMLETQVQFLSQEDPLEKGMVTHPSILAWRIPWTEERDRLYIVHGIAESHTIEQLTQL